MQVESLTCNNCGAPLDVPPTANYATCSYCGARLAIKRSDNAAYTEVLSRIEATTTVMAGDLRFMRLKSELEYLDGNWHDEETRLKAEKRDLEARLRKAKTANTGFGRPVLALSLGVFWLFATLASAAPPYLTWAGVLILVIALVDVGAAVANSRRCDAALVACQEADLRYKDSQQAYEQKRADLQRRLEAARSQGA